MVGPALLVRTASQVRGLLFAGGLRPSGGAILTRRVAEIRAFRRLTGGRGPVAHHFWRNIRSGHIGERFVRGAPMGGRRSGGIAGKKPRGAAQKSNEDLEQLRKLTDDGIVARTRLVVQYWEQEAALIRSDIGRSFGISRYSEVEHRAQRFFRKTPLPPEMRAIIDTINRRITLYRYEIASLEKYGPKARCSSSTIRDRVEYLGERIKQLKVPAESLVEVYRRYRAYEQLFGSLLLERLFSMR